MLGLELGVELELTTELELVPELELVIELAPPELEFFSFAIELKSFSFATELDFAIELALLLLLFFLESEVSRRGKERLDGGEEDEKSRCRCRARSTQSMPAAGRRKDTSARLLLVLLTGLVLVGLALIGMALISMWW